MVVLLVVLLVVLPAHAAHPGGHAHTAKRLHRLLHGLSKTRMLLVMLLLAAANSHARLRRGERGIRVQSDSIADSSYTQ